MVSKDKFEEQMREFFKDKKQILVPRADKYEEMVESVQKERGEGTKTPLKEANLIRRYSIRIENSKSTLYHNGDSLKEEPQQVVKQEDLYELLKATHEKLGHAGQDIMWKNLRRYYGISK